MRWTKIKPGQEGFYWGRRVGINGAGIAAPSVLKIVMDEGELCVFTFDYNNYDFFCVLSEISDDFQFSDSKAELPIDA